MNIKADYKRISSLKSLPIILILILTICSVVGMLSYYSTSGVLKDTIIQALGRRTEDNAGLISKHINSFKTIIEGIAFRTEVQSMDWEIQRPILIAEVKRINVKRIQVVDLSGFAHSTAGDTLDLSDREWVKKALKDETYISEPFLGRIDNSIIFVCATPIKNKYGKIIGALAATLDSQFLFDIIKDIKVGKTGYGFIVSKEGNMIAHPNKDFISADNKVISENLKIEMKEIISKEKGITFFRLDGLEDSAIYTPILDTNWILALTAPTKEAFNEINALKKIYIILTLAVIGISILFCILVIGYIMGRKIIADLEKCVEEDKRLLKKSAELETLRTQFFTNISHEFRTPLNVILSSLQLFKLYLEKEKALQSVSLNKHLRTMKQNCYRLLRLVNNLIDTTRMDVGFLETHMQNHNIVKIVEEITMSIMEFTRMKGIILMFNADVEDKTIACDDEKIERIVLNLLSNAIKFTHPGGNIFVNVFDKGESILISIKDTGIGIPKDKQEVIFERFMQVEDTLIRNNEGSGIGLSMSKSFVEMHGGHLTVVSEYGKGSEFNVELPVTILENEEDINRICKVQSQQRIERINIEFSDIYC